MAPLTSISPLQGKNNFFEKYDCEYYPTSGIVIDTAHLPGLLCFSNELISLDEIMH
jgi:hypothetical protein